jgi:hypothetical protein
MAFRAETLHAYSSAGLSEERKTVQPRGKEPPVNGGMEAAVLVEDQECGRLTVEWRMALPNPQEESCEKDGN